MSLFCLNSTQQFLMDFKCYLSADVIVQALTTDDVHSFGTIYNVCDCFFFLFQPVLFRYAHNYSTLYFFLWDINLKTHIKLCSYLFFWKTSFVSNSLSSVHLDIKKYCRQSEAQCTVHYKSGIQCAKLIDKFF